MRAWLPLARTVLGMVARKLPSPVEAQRKRVDVLWPLHLLPPLPATDALAPVAPPTTAIAASSSSGSEGGGSHAASATPPLAPLRPDMSLGERLRRVRDSIARCDVSPDADVVVFVSKMVAVPIDALPEHNHVEGLGHHVAAPAVTALAATPASAWYGVGGTAALDLRGVAAKGTGRLRRHGGGDAAGDAHATGGTGEGDLSATETFVAFARVFSGTLRPGALPRHRRLRGLAECSESFTVLARSRRCPGVCAGAQV